LEDLLACAVADGRMNSSFTPGEVGLDGLDLVGYVEAKARRMLEWHLAGGFRGILNSNIGNEIVGIDPLHPNEVAFIDFDSFCLVPTPTAPSEEEVYRFLLRASLEALRASLPIAALVIGPGGDLEGDSYRRRVIGTFEHRSSFFANY